MPAFNFKFKAHNPKRTTAAIIFSLFFSIKVKLNNSLYRWRGKISVMSSLEWFQETWENEKIMTKSNLKCLNVPDLTTKHICFHAWRITEWAANCYFDHQRGKDAVPKINNHYSLLYKVMLLDLQKIIHINMTTIQIWYCFIYL